MSDPIIIGKTLALSLRTTAGEPTTAELTAEFRRVREAVTLRREGKSTAEIKRVTGLSYYHQRQIYDAHNIPAPSRYGQTRRTILAMLDEGRLNQNQIAKHLGVSRQLVSEIKLHEQKKGVDNE